ncbi:exodeoxyribonuclease VII small subunit [Pseudanabaena sp. FACHB-1277]|jgi:exodeoxyribonuclease VII small subunit|uniref:Exodeoxyribonuclease 7 small subunit n=1 Tax=Pseudanabaena cinerea FACHB-1277 TaxID=2949581 RepID=A0A926Z7S2_9CYAN|nr:exodeoxyribonuclease VII small subunit [Pseudanabaena cinerea]MBD2152017.1 exodeoxyribonuclease VII small subunit [Pseudanabaena cinerea FACHB-1277]
MDNKSNKPTSESLSFEQQMQRLEEIVEILDDGEVALEQMLALYEEGIQRSQYCREYLEKAEQKITIIQGDDF